MATKNMAYDHPAYLVPVTSSDVVGTGATTTFARFAAYTAMVLKSVQVSVATLGTASSACTIYKISAGTTTTSLGAYAVSTQPVGYTTNILIGAAGTMAQGDSLYIVTGADATARQVAAYELNLVPGANVTA